MQKKQIAQTDCWVSPIGLGTVKIGRNEQVKYPDEFEIPEDDAVKALLNLALELNVNLIDTAPAYGNSEERLGRLLPGTRDDWHIATKVGEEFIGGQSVFNFTPEHIFMSVERSIKRLRTDYVDTVLIHSDGNDVEIIQKHGVLEMLRDLKQRGLVRCIGMSTKTVEGGLLALADADIVMATCNLDYHDELPVFEKAGELGKSIFVKKALASGHACLQTGEDPVKKSFEYVLSQPAVASAVVGTINPGHFVGNVELVSSIG